MDGRGTAVSREEGGVEIEAAEGRSFEHAFWKNLAVGGDDHDVGCERAEVVERTGGAEFFWLLDGKVVGEGDALDGGLAWLEVAAGGLVGLCDHANDAMVFRGEKGFEGGCTDFAGAAKDDAHF